MRRLQWYGLGALVMAACGVEPAEDMTTAEVADRIDVAPRAIAADPRALPRTIIDVAAQQPRGTLAPGRSGRVGADGRALAPSVASPAPIALGGAPGSAGLRDDQPRGGTAHDARRIGGGAPQPTGPLNGALGPFLNASGSCTFNVSAHGGRVLANPKVHRMFWGSYWTAAAHTAEASDYDTTWTQLASDPAFYTRLGEYGVNAGSAGSRWNLTTGATGQISEATIQAGIQSQLQAAGYAPTANDVFVVYLPSGTSDAADFNSSGVLVASGHHNHFSWSPNFFTSYDVVYAVIEYTSDRTYNNPVISHEIMEAASDPDLNAWWDSTPGNGGPEIGDICRFEYNNLAGVQVETTYSQKSCRCVRERPLDQLDYTGTGRPMNTVFRSGTWYGMGATSYWNFGQAGDDPIGGDYDGDGRTEYALFRAGTWFILNTSTGFYDSFAWGAPGDIPVPADYDGDGKTDKAVFRPSNGTWYIWYSATNTTSATVWGQAGDIPVPADFDNDGKADIAVRRPASSTWYVLPTTTPGSYTWAAWGVSSDIPVTGDFNGDGKSDWALFRPSEGRFYLWPKDTSTAWWVGWGTWGDIPVVRDFDGDWKADVAVWRPSNGTWYVANSSGGSSATAWGVNGDIPVLRLPPQ